MANPTSTLETIQQKVRRLTRSASTAQLTDADLNQYINTFVLYDFPEHLRLFDLRTTLTFYTQPFVDTYTTNTTNSTDPLYNFKNQYITIHPPVYCAGFQVLFSQSREQFYNIYPFLSSIRSIGTTGDGVTTSFSGNIGSINLNPPLAPTFTPVLQKTVSFESVVLSTVDGQPSYTGVVLVDSPVPGQTVGNLIIPDDPSTTYGTINYVNGNFSLNFPQPPGPGQAINSQAYQYVPSRPQAVLYYDDQFILRPVPDQVYPINMEVYIRPTALLAGQSPQLEQWWQYIAYGAAKKVFEDRNDLDSVALILPEYTKQEKLVLRKTIVQQTNERVYTIYGHQTDDISSAGGWFSAW